jgi:hypothetical protein
MLGFMQSCKHERRPTSRLPIIEQFVANIGYKVKSLPVGFVVVKGQGEHLIGYRTAVELGIVSN